MSIKKDFIIFSLQNCPYCTLVENLIKKHDGNYVKFVVDDIASVIDKQKLKDNISKLVQQEIKPFPIVFTSEMEFIGGYDDTEYFIHNLIKESL